MAEKVVKGGFRASLALVVAVIALIFSLVSYRRTGGLARLENQIEVLEKTTVRLKEETIQQVEKLEKRTNKALENLGKTLRLEDVREKKETRRKESP